MKEQETYSFSLRKIQTDQFATIEDAFEEGKKVELNTGIKFGTDKQAKVVAVSTLFRFKQQNHIFLLIEISCFFGLETATWELSQKEEELVLPKSLAQHLVMFTIGTARGALHSKTENSPFNRFFIPPLDVTELVQTDVKVD